MSTMSDGGKGSDRRVEDSTKVGEGFTRIWGESKLDRKLREEREAMQEINDDAQDYNEEEWTCDACGGPMYSAPHWSYGQCDDCGATQELINDDYI